MIFIYQIEYMHFNAINIDAARSIIQLYKLKMVFFSFHNAFRSEHSDRVCATHTAVRC